MHRNYNDQTPKLIREEGSKKDTRGSTNITTVTRGQNQGDSTENARWCWYLGRPKDV